MRNAPCEGKDRRKARQRKPAGDESPRAQRLTGRAASPRYQSSASTR